MIKVKRRNELKAIIEERISKFGVNCDLNDIDVSGIIDMSSLFFNSDFNGDISKWDVSKVEDMSLMFCRSKFNGDISNWDVSNVYNMENMFYRSNFKGDVNNWNVSNVRNMDYMFLESKFNGDIGKWVFNEHCSKRDFLTLSKYVAKSYDNFEVDLSKHLKLVKEIERLKAIPNIENVLSCKKDLSYLESCYLQCNGDVENIVRSYVITQRIKY